MIAAALENRTTRTSILVTNVLIIVMAGAFLFLCVSNLLNHEAYENDASGILYHYALPALLAAGAASLLFLSPARRVNAGLTSVSVVFTLLAVETGLYVYENEVVTQDDRHQVQVVAEMRLSGSNAYPAVIPAWFLNDHLQVDGRETFPIGGMSRTTVVHCNELGKLITYESDERGFNNPTGLWSDTVEFVLVGDSFTHGACVAREHTIGGRLRRSIGRGISLGMDGSGPLIQLASVREYAELRPRYLIWLFFEGNDLIDLVNESKDSVLTRYLFEPDFTQDLPDRQEALDRALAGYIDEESSIRHRIRNASPLLAILRLRSLRARLNELRKQAPLNPKAEPVAYTPHPGRAMCASTVEPFSTILELVDEAVREWGGEVVFGYLPQWERYATPNGANPCRSDVLDAAAALGLNVVDLHPVFEAHPDPLALFSSRTRRGHYSIEGYRLVAAGLTDALVSADE